MPNVRASSGMIGTIRLPTFGSRIRLRRIRANTIVVETAVVLPDANSASTRGLGLGQGLRAHDAARQRPAEQLAPLLQVLHLLRVGAGVEVRRVLQLVVGDRQLEAVAEDLELGLAELLRLVGDVPRLDARPEGPALDGLGEDHRRGADVLGRRLVRGVDLAVVVAAAAQLEDVVVGEVLDDPAQPRVRAEEVLADVVAARHRVLLELAVEGLVHLLDQHAVDVARQQLVPLAAPDDLDHVPAGAAEQRPRAPGSPCRCRGRDRRGAAGCS